MPDNTLSLAEIEAWSSDRIAEGSITLPSLDGKGILAEGQDWLSWTVTPAGNVSLEVRHADEVILARMIFISDEEVDERYSFSDDFEIQYGSVVLDVTERYKYGADLRTDLCYDHHVHALKRCAVTLLTTSGYDEAVAKTRVEAWLAPLSAVALAWPCTCTRQARATASDLLDALAVGG